MVELSTWDALLRTYVDGDGRVDYRAWQAEQPRTLSDWLALQSPATRGSRSIWPTGSISTTPSRFRRY